VINIRQKAVQKTAFRIIRISRAIRFGVMYVVRHYIYFLRDHTNRQILCEKPPEMIAKFVSAMRAISVVPDGTVCSHNEHAVYERGDQQWNGKKF